VVNLSKGKAERLSSIRLSASWYTDGSPRPMEQCSTRLLEDQLGVSLRQSWVGITPELICGMNRLKPTTFRLRRLSLIISRNGLLATLATPWSWLERGRLVSPMTCSFLARP